MTSSSTCRVGIANSIWVLVCAGLAAGCSDYEPETDRLPGPIGLAKWRCLASDETQPVLPSSSSDPVTYKLKLVNLSTNEPFRDEVKARACGLNDVYCDNPSTDWVLADEDGVVHVPLRKNFEGYLEIISPSAVPYIFNLPDTGLSEEPDFPLAMIALTSFGGLLEVLKLPFDDKTEGAIGVRAFDCNGDPTEGVVLRTAAGGAPWYFEGGAPTTVRQQTDPQGLGGFIGATPGLWILEATLPDADRTVTARMSIITRVGFMTAGYLRPYQAPPQAVE
jgi:hypothetical protein